MKKILSFLESQKIDSDDINPRLEYAISFYEKFFQKYPENDLYAYKDLDFRDYLIIFLAKDNPERLFDIENFICGYDKFFDILTRTNYCYLLLIVTHPLYRKISDARSKFALFKKIPYVQQLIDAENLELKPTADTIFKLIFDPYLIDNFIELLESLSITLEDGRNFADDIVWFSGFADFLMRRPENKIIHKFLEKGKEVNELRLIIKKRHYEGERAKNEFLRQSSEAAKQNHLIDRINEYITQNPDYLPVDIIKKVMRMPISDEIKDAFLNYAGELNNKKNTDTLEVYEASQNTPEKVIMRVLARFNFDLNILETSQKNQVLAMDANDLEIILSFLATHHIAYDSVQSFACFDVNKIKTVDNSMTKGILNERFLQRHLSIVLKDNPDFDLIQRNISLLYQAGINIINYQNSVEILLGDIRNNLDYLSFYGLQIDKKVSSIIFLKDPNLLAKLDLAIEMNLLDEEGLDILNYSIEKIYQMGLCKKLGINYDSSLFKSIPVADLVPNPSLQIESGMLELFQAEKTVGTLPEYLKTYVANERKLVIEGIIISLPRFLRNLSVIDSSSPEEVYMAAIYGSHYTIDETQVIQRTIAPGIEDALKKHKKNEE